MGGGGGAIVSQYNRQARQQLSPQSCLLAGQRVHKQACGQQGSKLARVRAGKAQVFWGSARARWWRVGVGEVQCREGGVDLGGSGEPEKMKRLHKARRQRLHGPAQMRSGYRPLRKELIYCPIDGNCHPGHRRIRIAWCPRRPARWGHGCRR